MEFDYVQISLLNDFVFCPYSIYLHNVYLNTDESLYHATPQTRGKLAHETIDEKRTSTRKDVIESLSVYSEKYGLVGKIDLYKTVEKALIERKYQLKRIFQGQIYQLWAQFFCLEEMGFKVESLFFSEISTKKLIPVKKPNDEERAFFEKFLKSFRDFDPSEPFIPNPEKCSHCIYFNLCDKTVSNNVYI